MFAKPKKIPVSTPKEILKFKAMIVGDNGVGKTEFVKRISDSSTTTSDGRTIGVDTFYKKIETKNSFLHVPSLILIKDDILGLLWFTGFS